MENHQNRPDAESIPSASASVLPHPLVRDWSFIKDIRCNEVFDYLSTA